MDIIQLLPDHVANQIAAGEVIQRPASVVKELLENSLDAGANEISLLVKDSGKTLIQVIDNGCGMSQKDAHLCFERHATSKIKEASDLFKLSSMGFRGEAMASIGAIAHVELETKQNTEDIGRSLIIEGNQLKNEKACVRNTGTSVKIKNLFYNVPARRNFLKSDKIEFRHITEEFKRIALSRPEIKMNLIHNEQEIFHLEKSNFRQRIINITSPKNNEKLVPVNEETTVVTIDGFIGKPSFAKRTRGEQYFFVNGRFIKSYYLNHAITKAFEGLIADNFFPSYFINLTIDPEHIDVNIHPTKTEIKFDDEKVIYSIIRATIKRSLGKYNIAPSLDFNQETSFNLDFNAISTPIKEPQIKIDENYNPFIKENENSKNITIEENQQLTSLITTENQKIDVIQILNQYIMSINNTGFIIIHQRRAHKRILFEHFCKRNQQDIIKQELLFPKRIHFSKTDEQIILDIIDELSQLGFNIESSESGTFVVKSIPSICKEQQIQSILEELIEQHKNQEKLNLKQKEKIASSLANTLAVPKNKPLLKEEITLIAKQLLDCEQPNICPQGRQTILKTDLKDLKKYFKDV